MRLIKWLWSIATGSMPDTTGKPQGSTRPCLWSHSSPANASSALPLRFFWSSLCLLVSFSPSVLFAVVFLVLLKREKNKMNIRHDKKIQNKTATFDGSL